MSIDRIVSESRNEVLNALKPILEEISNENGNYYSFRKKFCFIKC